jgi:hypothetical protein
MSAEYILNRLQGVRKRTSDQWSARCPAHDDKGPSLSIRELDDGRTLLHCFAGCDVADVVAAVGLELDSLFPPGPPDYKIRHERKPRLVTLQQALEICAIESLTVYMIAADIARGQSPDLNRLALATARIQAVTHGATQ